MVVHPKKRFQARQDQLIEAVLGWSLTKHYNFLHDSPYFRVLPVKLDTTGEAAFYILGIEVAMGS
ncbi:hypothetical protein [Dictyobacter arantiisoli]|uniref:Uncharacterized protein n=1 Tax=Dictyobacter arantiisoli TaxID=2014874 RepID=A0A5A5TGJ9_9CHLR|nr:hypothetical protein [Dictyobacter arantiisoli]GCF10348.1 hypothetical protein KDI_39120 [Dictyobacter arantiisoli]